MCGISGIWSLKNGHLSPQVLESLIRKMVESQKHRGPDDTGFFSDHRKGLYLGFNRLSFQDLSSAGNQPMKGKRWVIVFNGEIYNFKSLRNECKNSGWIFKSNSDSEVILACFEIWGIQKLEQFDGMYSIAAFDLVENELYLIRDLFGEKPLYYLIGEDNTVIFSSELKGIEQGSSFKLDLDLSSIASYFTFQYIPSPRTIYSKVGKVRPGQFIKIKSDLSIEEVTYNEIFNPIGNYSLDPGMSHEKIISEVKNLLCKSIEKRLISDVDLGAFLSSGIDSSLVCALIRREFGIELNTFSVGFENSKESEHFQAEITADYLGTNHHSLILKPSDFTFLDSAGKMLDEPLADSSCLPVYEISKFSSTRVKGIITGDGGDEIFSGYPRYLSTLSEFQRRPEAEPWELYFPMLQIGNLNLIENIFGFIPDGTQNHINQIKENFNSYTSKNGFLSAMRKIDSYEYLPGAVLAKVDRMSMLNSLETRTPFLEPNLVKFAANLDELSLIGARRSKFVLRELANQLIPGVLSNLPKKGFGFPLTAEWINEIYQRTDSIKLKDSSMSEIFGIEFSERLTNIANSKKYGTPYFAWATLILESWLTEHKEFINIRDEKVNNIVERKIFHIPSKSSPKILLSLQIFTKSIKNKISAREIDSILSFVGLLISGRLLKRKWTKITRNFLLRPKILIGKLLSENKMNEEEIDLQIDLNYFTKQEEKLNFGTNNFKSYLYKLQMKLNYKLRYYHILNNIIQLFFIKPNQTKDNKKIIMIISGEIFILPQGEGYINTDELIFKIKRITSNTYSLNNSKIDSLKKLGFTHFNNESIFVEIDKNINNLLDGNIFKAPVLNNMVRSLDLSSLQYTSIGMHKIFRESIEIWYVEEPGSLPLILVGLKNKVGSYRIINKRGLQFNNALISDRVLFFMLLMRYINVQISISKIEKM
jgi:asparagine synthase (glutamine-hydrolysing)